MGDFGDGCMQSYQVLSRVQGQAGNTYEGRMKCVWWLGGAWGRLSNKDFVHMLGLHEAIISKQIRTHCTKSSLRRIRDMIRKYMRMAKVHLPANPQESETR
jgi:hypothetical protein